MKQALITIAFFTFCSSGLLAQNKNTPDSTRRKNPVVSATAKEPDSVYVPQLGKKVKVDYNSTPEKDLPMMRQSTLHPLNDVIDIPESTK
jgi:hypothetical protein